MGVCLLRACVLRGVCRAVGPCRRRQQNGGGGKEGRERGQPRLGNGIGLGGGLVVGLRGFGLPHEDTPGPAGLVPETTRVKFNQGT